MGLGNKPPHKGLKVFLFAVLGCCLAFGMIQTHHFLSQREWFTCEDFQSLQKRGRPTFMLVTHKPFFSEREFLTRSQNALHHLGYPSFIQLMPENAESPNDYSWAAKLYYRLIEWYFKPQIVFCMPAFCVHPFHKARTYAFVTDHGNVAHVSLHSFNTLLMAAPDMRLCPDYVAMPHQTFLFDFYPTHPHTTYEASTPAKIYFGGNLWDENAHPRLINASIHHWMFQTMLCSPALQKHGLDIKIT